jgi:acetylornithine deacetylase/succinyl-diaminopimelate desuccinylase-like protein
VSDDKASMLIPILAAEACFANGRRPPVNLRFLFEAEEEIGSPACRGWCEGIATIWLRRGARRRTAACGAPIGRA